MADRPWEADPSANLNRRLGKSARELGDTNGRNHTSEYALRLPPDVHIGDDERLVIIPRNMLITAKPDIPDA
jgi:hypothetical protein